MSTTVPTAREMELTNTRIDNWAQLHKELDKKVKALEARGSWGSWPMLGPELFKQEYPGPRTVTTLSVTDEEMEKAAKTFVRSIGTVNRRYLKHTVQDSSGDAAKALRYALSLYPMAM